MLGSLSQNMVISIFVERAHCEHPHFLEDFIGEKTFVGTGVEFPSLCASPEHF